MEGHTAPYHKMEPTNSVRRPEKWHMAQGGGGGSSNGRPYSTLSQNGTHQQ
ncbi:unnamed protein product, partial [Staurois parvus]